jgi:hypothetical protein
VGLTLVPVLRRRDALVPDPVPPFGIPQPGLFVAAVLDELEVGPAGDRRLVQVIVVHLDLVGGALVV